jgi:signal transduction histidine kinase/PAS domain-containing protein
VSPQPLDPPLDPARTDLLAPPERAAAADVALAVAEALLASSTVGVAILDRGLRYVRVNDTLAAMNGRPAADHVGRSIHDVVPDAAPLIEPLLRRVLETNQPILDLAIALEHPAGVRRQFLGSWHPVRSPAGEVTGLLGMATERVAGEESERRAIAAATREANRARALQRIITKLNDAATSAQVGTAVVDDALEALGADAGSLAFVVRDDDGRPTHFESARSDGYGDTVTAKYARYPVVPGRPLSDVVLGNRGVFVESPAQWDAAWPTGPEALDALGFQSFAAVPVEAGDRVIAALSFSFRERQRFDDGLRVFLATIAEQCALALERVRLDEAQRRAMEHQAAILATIHDPFVVLDDALRYSYVNARAEELLQRGAAELLGRRLVDVFPEAADTPIERALHRVIATRHAEQLEAFSPVANRWIEARMSPAPGGVTLLLQDVTSRRRRQDAATFLADASRQLAASLDHEATIRAVANAAVPMLGDWCVVTLVDDPEARAWPPQLQRVAVVHHDPAKVALAEELTARYPVDWDSPGGMAGVLRNGTPAFVPAITDGMLVAMARDAEHLALLRELEFSAAIIVPLVARGLILGALTLCMTGSGRRYDVDDLALAHDLAQRQALAVDNARLYQQAERARAEAEAANRAKSEFLAVMSHELRTPLNAIGGYVQLLDMGIHGPVTAEQRLDLERIQRSQVHLSGIINEVLNFARLESGTVTYDIGPVPVVTVVEEVVPLLEPQRAAKSLEIAVHRPAAETRPALLVLADRDKLLQVLLNLLSNAVKFTPAGGRITVSVRVESGEPDSVVLEVADSGIGIPEDKLEAIFEPFVQIDRTLKNPAEGTGLGLAISRELARGMGGDLSATSTPGAGSTFALRLRLA